MSNKVFSLEVDLPQEMKASLTTKCDECGAVLGQGYARGKDNMSLYLKDGKDDNGYDKSRSFDFCDEACLRDFLNGRHEDMEAKASAHGDSLVLSLEDEPLEDEAYARYISTKDRDNMKESQFLDEKRRSFPIKNCTDVKAAVRAWGRYKGTMSFDEFKAKLSRKAKAMGCSLPEKWTDEKK